MAANITVASGAYLAKVGKALLFQAQNESIINSLLQPESAGTLLSAPGVKINGSQGVSGDPMRHRTFTMRNYSHLSPMAIGAGDTMKDNPERFDIGTVTGTRDLYAKTVASTALVLTSLDFDLLAIATEELKNWVHMTPFDAQFFFNLSPYGAYGTTGTDALAANNFSTYVSTDSGSMWYIMREKALAGIVTILDAADIGCPDGTNETTTYKQIRAAFLSKSPEGIDRDVQAGTWTGMTTNNVPTVKNLRAYKTYLTSKNLREPTFTLWGNKYKGFITFVNETFFDALQDDPTFTTIQQYIEPKGMDNTVFKGVGRVLQLHGMFFVGVSQYDSLFTNHTPLYSARIGDGTYSQYLGVTLTAGSFMTSMYESPKLTHYEADHEGFAPQIGIQVIIGTKVLQDIETAYSGGAVTTPVARDRVSYMCYVAPSA